MGPSKHNPSFIFGRDFKTLRKVAHFGGEQHGLKKQHARKAQKNPKKENFAKMKEKKLEKIAKKKVSVLSLTYFGGLCNEVMHLIQRPFRGVLRPLVR